MFDLYLIYIYLKFAGYIEIVLKKRPPRNQAHVFLVSGESGTFFCELVGFQPLADILYALRYMNMVILPIRIFLRLPNLRTSTRDQTMN